MFLKISINAPSLTPTAPGEGIPETVANNTDCIVVSSNILLPLWSSAQYVQYAIL